MTGPTTTSRRAPAAAALMTGLATLLLIVLTGCGTASPTPAGPDGRPSEVTLTPSDPASCLKHPGQVMIDGVERPRHCPPLQRGADRG
jgi:hypothetical protein